MTHCGIEEESRGLLCPSELSTIAWLICRSNRVSESVSYVFTARTRARKHRTMIVRDANEAITPCDESRYDSFEATTRQPSRTMCRYLDWHVDELFARFDLDGSGNLTIHEFTSFLGKERVTAAQGHHHNYTPRLPL